MSDEQIRQIIREELYNLFKTDRIIFDKNIQILDGRNIQTGRSNGTMIAEKADQKIGFFGKTPAIQQTTSVSAGSFNAVSGTTVLAGSTFSGYTIGKVVEALRNLGLLA